MKAVKRSKKQKQAENRKRGMIPSGSPEILKRSGPMKDRSKYNRKKKHKGGEE